MKKFILFSCLFMGGIGLASAQTANKSNPVKKAEKPTAAVTKTEPTLSKGDRPKPTATKETNPKKIEAEAIKKGVTNNVAAPIAAETFQNTKH